MKHSVWWELTSLPSFTPLQGDKKTDVLIIGGGMAGLLCAHMLKQARVSYILVEADRLCSGVTKNTTAKITAQHGLIYHKLLRRFGMERTRMYLEANLAAIREFRTLCGTIDCAFEEQTSCVYSQWDAKKTELEITALDQLDMGIPTASVYGLIGTNGAGKTTVINMLSGVLTPTGGKILLVMEGRWENIWDCFLEVPKDSLVLSVDDDDFLKAHEVLGEHQILLGGLKLGDTRLKKFDQIKDDIKRVIDTCAPGGGLILNTDKGFLTPGDVNPTLIECYNFAHEYSKK